MFLQFPPSAQKMIGKGAGAVKLLRSYFSVAVSSLPRLSRCLTISLIIFYYFDR